MTAGRRLGDETYSFQFSHRTRLSTWNVSYAEDVTTSREQFFVPATQSTAGALEQMFLSQYPDPVARQKAVQEFIARMGLPPSLGSPINFFSDRLFLQKRWLASAGLQGVPQHARRDRLLGRAQGTGGKHAVAHRRFRRKPVYPYERREPGVGLTLDGEEHLEPPSGLHSQRVPR